MRLPYLDDEPSFRLILSVHVLPLLKALTSVCLATVLLLMFDRIIPINLCPVIYLIPVVVAATRWGTAPAIVAALAGAAGADVLFFPPYYSLRIDDPQEVIDLMLFLFVALVSSYLALRLRSEKERLKHRELELRYLYDFSRRLAACFTIPDLLDAIQSYLASTLDQQALYFTAKADQNIETVASGTAPQEVKQRVGWMIAEAGLSACTIFDQSTHSVWLLQAVYSEKTVHGVIAVNIGSGPPVAIQSKTRQVEAILNEASSTLQRLDIGRAMEEARLRLQAQLLKDALHGMLSHELRSPLAAIQGSATVLASAPTIRADNRLHLLSEGITDEVQKLDRFIQNLVDTARVTTNSVQPRLEWTDPRDIVASAVKLRDRRLAEHHINIRFDDDLPLIRVDSALVEEALGQLLDNAAKYSPSRTSISITVRARQAEVVLSVSDQGSGITADEKDSLGLRSFRGERHRNAVPGSGLGFWIASTFVRANRGTITISSRGEGLGTLASIVLPASWVEDTDYAALIND